MRKFILMLAASFAAMTLSVSGSAEVTEEQLRAHIAILASDDFEGREPGTPGEKKTIEYIAGEWKKSRLIPAAKDGSWFEPVALVERSIGSAETSFYNKGRKLRFADSEILLTGTEADYQNGSLPVFFAGYGVNAKGNPVGDVAGKLVLMFAGGADYLPVDKRSPRARREILVKAGAQAVVLIADSAAAGSWPALRRQMGSSGLALQAREIRAPLQGAVSAEFAVGLATAAAQDWDRISMAAATEDFAGIDFGITADVKVTTNVRRFNSYNVIGKIPGKKKNLGAVLYMGHWDHLGLCRPEGDADRICNGAVDNASGIAVLAEVARALGRKRHDRDIYFIATTAEESGLLGAYSFADNPVIPLGDIVAALNIDTIAIAPRRSKVAIIGRGTTKLDGIIETVARGLKREIEPSNDANAFIRRQDGWALAEKGVPALMVGGSFADMKKLQVFLSGDYHGPGDELTGNTELGGAAEDTDLHIALGKYFASGRKYSREKTEQGEKAGD